MDPIGAAEGWLFKVAVRKAVTAGVKAVVSLLVAVKVQAVLTQLGVQYDPVKFETGLAAFLYMGIEAAHDWAKLKYPNVVRF